MAVEALVYVALWLGLVWLTNHLEREAQADQRRQGQSQNLIGRKPDDASGLRWVPPAKDVDPACGKLVSTQGARSSVYAGNVYYFCSRDCREVFEAAPELHVAGDSPIRQTIERGLT